MGGGRQRTGSFAEPAAEAQLLCWGFLQAWRAETITAPFDADPAPLAHYMWGRGDLQAKNNNGVR